MAWEEPAADVGEQLVANEKPDADRGLLLELARAFAKAPKYTPDSLRTDKDLLLRVVREHREGWRMLKQATPQLRADRELLVATVKGSAMGWRALAFAASDLREDRELCLEAVRRNAAALELVAPRLRQDRDLVSEALSAISRRLQAPAPKAAVQDWERLAASSHVPMKSKSKKKSSVADAVSQDRNEEWAERLRREVEGGLCSVHHDPEGETCRVVPLMCLRIHQPNGLILAVLGKVDVDWMGSFDARARCILPGTRILDGEQPRDSLNRFLQTTLAPLAKGLEIDGDFQVVVEEGTSLKFDLQTRYLRSIFNAHVDAKFQWKKVASRLGMSHVRSPRSSPQAVSLGRRFCTGTASYSAPLPPDMYVLTSKAHEYGYGQLPQVTKSVSLYAWIPVWEYEWLRNSETGRDTLKSWLAKISLNPGHAGRVTLRPSASELPGAMSRNVDEVDNADDSDGSSETGSSGEWAGAKDGFTDRTEKMPPLVSPKSGRRVDRFSG